MLSDLKYWPIIQSFRQVLNVYHFNPVECFTLIVTGGFQWSSSDNKFLQHSRIFRGILADFHNAMVFDMIRPHYPQKRNPVKNISKKKQQIIPQPFH